MTREQAFDYLDSMLTMKKRIADLSDKIFEEHPGTKFLKDYSGLHLWDIRDIADAVGPVKLETSYCTPEYPLRVSFTFSGVEVFAIYPAEEEKEIKAWMKEHL